MTGPTAGSPAHGIDRRYPASRTASEPFFFELARVEGRRKLVVETPDGMLPTGLASESARDGGHLAVCPLSSANAAWMRNRFPHLAPRANPGRAISIGLGDRLGKASAGHLRALAGLPVFPVLAQQSMRELRLTGRTYEDVLDAATWAVFETGWKDGYGADGDHLKTGEELDYALGCGFTMITLDCSDHIDKALANLPDAEIHARYLQLPAQERADAEARYLDGGEPKLLELGVFMDRAGFERRLLTYRGAVAHSVDMYRTRIATAGRPVDFEVSIDETATVTSPADHAYVALELLRRDVRVLSIAPRFCGEFQKGVDYRGDVARFRVEFAEHAAIARRLGYRVSVHSGSDKFLVFPIIGEEAPEGFHLKTAGTHWLEALRVLAAHEPALFREILRVALASLPDARNFYHISGEASRVAPEASLSDARLPGLLDQDDARQILHITYGHVLRTAEKGGGTLGDRIHDALDRLEPEYAAGLGRHLARHTDGLGLRKDT
jgi:tagaturonate epimerase